MEKKIRPISRIWFSILSGGLVFILASACLQTTPGTQRRVAAAQTSDSEDENGNPRFPKSSNYFQNGTVISSGNFPLAHDFDKVFYLKGKEIHNFIKDERTEEIECLISVFESSTVNRILVMAAIPKSSVDLAKNTQEFYYTLEPNGTNNNQALCRTPGLISTLERLHPTKGLVFRAVDVCPNCVLDQLVSNSEFLLDQSGRSLQSSVNLDYLRLNLIMKSLQSSDSIPENGSCKSTPECQAKGFDCCSFGQCVKDRQLKSGIDTSSSEYAQAQADIQNDPSSVYNYPQFYHLCPTRVVQSDTSSDSIIEDPHEEARQHFLELERLYQCTVVQEGEMSLCTISYSDVRKATSNQFSTNPDDRSFSSVYSGNISLPQHSIYKITYAGETLFENNRAISGVSLMGQGTSSSVGGNDNLSDRQIISINHTPSSTAPHDNLHITYKVDGSCEKVNSTLAKCYKEYVQGQNLGQVNDHFPASNIFALPYYADLNRSVHVKVGDERKAAGTHWEFVYVPRPGISFLGDNLQVHDTQVVIINFYVDLISNPNLIFSKEKALDKIKKICECVGTDCHLKPKRNDENKIIDYVCDYPQPHFSTPPLQQVVQLSSKTAPHLYFDSEGVYHDQIDKDTPPQEGNLFEYVKNDLLKPNNVDDYVGFNEIYGSFQLLDHSAQAAKEIPVKKGRTYDVYTEEGRFSNCFFCGNDYYSQLTRIFPENFAHKGGGFRPDIASSEPFETKTYRKDDLLFGRACWLPATMIPWTHRPQFDLKAQRLERLSAQHFLFANGYQRDWYGFDYGSVIGSWDGVAWFSIGNQLRVKARSNKLFLAINAYFSDLTNPTSFRITVQDTPYISGSGPTVFDNTESDGAECQKFHLCETDRDCAANLGWDYHCESVASLSSKWPTFGTDGMEIPNAERVINLKNEFGSKHKGIKRCIYRGRGAPCQNIYNVTNPDINYSMSTQSGLHHCSYNNYCQPLVEGVPAPLFNAKISRYGKSVKQQNSSPLVPEDDLDTFGLHIRSLGRPYAWRGDESLPFGVEVTFYYNNISSLCLPGRMPGDLTFEEGHNFKPTTPFLGDKVNGIGMTPENEGSPGFLSSCSIMDEEGNYLYKDFAPSTFTNNNTIVNLAAQQAIATNALTIFESADMADEEIVKNFESEQIEEVYLQENRCLRAPGSVCFSSMDCASNAYISSKIAHVNAYDANLSSILNPYEIQFWQEKLVCSGPHSPEDEEFDTKNNRCCREVENDLSIGSATIGSGTLNTWLIPGQSTVQFSDSERYHRMSTVWDLMTGSLSASYPVLQVTANDSCLNSLSTCTLGSVTDSQYNTFAAIADRTCCSEHWVREFHREDNGGGHIWGADKMQTVPKESLRCLNWLPCTVGVNCGGEASLGYFSCEHTADPDDPVCLMRSTSLNQARPYFDFLGTLELAGIPSVKVKTRDWNDVYCKVNPDDQSDTTGITVPLPNLIADANTEPSEYKEGNAVTGNRYFSAGDAENFNSQNLKMVFEPDRVVCCLPAGTKVDSDTDPERCCTGFINRQNQRCQLPDYTNVSVYTNRYVSSAAKERPLSSFDVSTGYLRAPADVIQVACSQRICASGRLAVGVALTNLKYPGHESSEKLVQRFIDGNDEANNDLGLADIYDEGMRWNTHVYCVPDQLQISTAIDCSGL